MSSQQEERYVSARTRENNDSIATDEGINSIVPEMRNRASNMGANSLIFVFGEDSFSCAASCKGGELKGAIRHLLVQHPMAAVQVMQDLQAESGEDEGSQPVIAGDRDQ